MRNSLFLRALVWTLIITAALLFLLRIIIPFPYYNELSVAGLIAFTLLSFGVYYVGQNWAKSPNKYLYIHLVIYNLMAKLFVSFLLLALFYKLAKPEQDLFVLPFLVIYLCFTIFETFFMSKQARESSDQ